MLPQIKIFRSAAFTAGSFLLTCLAGCSSDRDVLQSPTPTNSTPTPNSDSEEFISALAGGSVTNGDDDAPAEDGSGDDENAERDVEEADIFVQEGDLLYLLNMYRGVQIVDVSNPDQPVLEGRVPLTGYPVEMYVEDTRAYVVVSDYFTYMRTAETDGDQAVSSFYGSTLAIIDVQDPKAPALLGRIDLEGYIGQTRRVGDVIYAVSSSSSYQSCSAYTEDVVDEVAENSLTVISVDISDPSNPHTVATLAWPGSYAQVYATSDTFYIIEPDYEYVSDGGATTEGTSNAEVAPATAAPDDSAPADTQASEATPTDAPADTPAEKTPEDVDSTPAPDTTPIAPGSYSYLIHLTYVDISDPHGAMLERGRIDIPGTTWDKFAIDEHNEVIRIVTQKWDGISSGTITTVDVSEPDDLTQLATLDIMLPELESVTATSFDGDRGYVVTAASSDPLFVVDLRDPVHPTLAGQVEMSGMITHIEPRDDRLIALGQDNADSGTWKFAVSLFDVADLYNPSLIDRVSIGDGQYSWSQATWDEKAFSVMDAEGLLAVPFSAETYTETGAVGEGAEDDSSYYIYTYTGGVQLVDFDNDGLTLRGMVTHPGYVTRVRPVNTRLASMSDTDLLMINIDDRDAPAVTADVTLARNLTDYLPNRNYGVQLSLASYYGDGLGALRVVSNSSPDDVDTALGELDLEITDGQLFPVSETRVGLIRSNYDYDTYTYEPTLEVYDISDPHHPSRTAFLELPAPVWSYMDNYNTYYGSSGGALVQADRYVAFLEATFNYATPDTGNSEPASDSSSSAGGKIQLEDNLMTPAPEDPPLSQLHVVDLSEPDAPALTSLPFDQSLFGLRADGSMLYATHAEQINDSSTARYYTDIFDLSDPQNPIQTESINIPGTLLHVMDNGHVLVTLDPQWTTIEENGYSYDYVTYSLRTVRIEEGRAHALDALDLEGYTYTLTFSDQVAYVLAQSTDVYTTDGCSSYGVQLMTIALEDPSALRTTDVQWLPGYYGYARALAGGRLFIDGGNSGLLVYNVEADPLTPAYQTFVRTSGWVNHVRTEGSIAYLPSGLYGVNTVDLLNDVDAP